MFHRQILLVIVAALLSACTPGTLSSGRLGEVGGRMDALESQLKSGDAQACLDYLQLCELASSLCLQIGTDPDAHQSCTAIGARCSVNLAKYCPDVGTDGGSDSGPTPGADAGSSADTTAPSADSAPPADTTAPPADTTAPPADTTAPPADTTAPPADTTAPPADTTAPPPPTGGKGLWTSAAELAQRPMSGTAWSNVKSAADGSLGSADIYDQDSKHPVLTMAVAIVYARTQQASYRKKAADAIMSAIVSGPTGRSLALGRNLAAYVIAADLIDLAGYDAAKDQQFKSFIGKARFWTNTEGRSLVQCHDVRPNNWGTMCGASRIAADLYLNDATDLAKAVAVTKGYLGDRSAYAGFSFGSDASSWMCDPSKPRPLNPAGCSKDGHDLSGAAVDDVRRGGTYTWPPNPTHYAWGGFSAAAAQVELLHRAGYPAYSWQQQAVLRGMTFLQSAMASSQSNATEWLPYLVNFRYGTSFPVQSPIGVGRLVGWTSYTHGK